MNVSHVQRRLNSANDNILCFLMVVYCNVFRKQLTDTLTSIIFTGSVQHHALNAPHHIYSYMPHRPTMLTKYIPVEYTVPMLRSSLHICRNDTLKMLACFLRWMPEGEGDISWSWIKEALPSIQLTKAGSTNILITLCLRRTSAPLQ